MVLGNYHNSVIPEKWMKAGFAGSLAEELPEAEHASVTGPSFSL